MRRIVVVTGTPGAGKTTVLKKVMEKIGNRYKIVNYGDIMLEIARERKLVENRDEIRKLDANIQREIQKEAAKKISEMAKDSNIIVDTHCLIKTPEGYLPGLPIWVLEELRPNVIVLIEANPDEIIRRRERDKTRYRDVEMEKELKLHQEMNRAIATAYAMITGATVKIVENHDGKLNEAVEELLKVLI